MTRKLPGLWWAAPGSFQALIGRARLRETVEAYWQTPLVWRQARLADWPSGDVLCGEFVHAKEDGSGFTSDLGRTRLFLAPGEWGESEWQLAETDLETGRWRYLGDIYPLSSEWVMPVPGGLS
ncbi:hypothetical protein [Brevundimonas lutea]|uniref:hypothetical protein n=1 Tax=Brevundimonas lutea TaxID=2293980 RepID=UPI000F036303|nr:hypothetical protein [Brevundimonas lutea]